MDGYWEAKCVGKNVITEAVNAHIVVMVIAVMAKKELILVGMETVPMALLQWRLKKVTGVSVVLRPLLQQSR